MMQKHNIKYEALSSEIKKEIELFYTGLRKHNDGLSLEEAMSSWFEKEFDLWMVRNYPAGPKDRRMAERRKSVRIEPGKNDGGKSDRRQAPRRKKFRIDIEVPVEIVETLIESSSDDKGAIDFVGTLVNISKGGFYFSSPRPIEISSIIKVRIDLSNIDGDISNIEALAMVMRVDRMPDGNYGVGVMFSSIYDENREKLDIFIFKNLAYYIVSS